MNYLNSRIMRMDYWEKNGKKCEYCDSSVSWENLTMDHIIASANGGKDKNSNLVCSCSDCNSAKSNMDVYTFEKYVKAIPTFLRKNLMFRILLRHYDVKITRKSNFITKDKIIKSKQCDKEFTSRSKDRVSTMLKKRVDAFIEKRKIQNYF